LEKKGDTHAEAKKKVDEKDGNIHDMEKTVKKQMVDKL